MKRIGFSVLVVMFVSFMIALAQGPGALWTRTYGGTANDEAMSIQQTTDGGYIVAGYTFSFVADGVVDAYVVKLNGAGDTLWTHTFANGGNEAFYSVQQTTDGGFVMTGFTGPADNSAVFLVKTDADGLPQWTRSYGGNGFDEGHSVNQLPDGGFIIAGYTNSFGAGNYDVWVIRTNSVGDTLWTRTNGGAGEDKAWAVGQTTDGGYFVAGSRYESWVPPDGNWDMFLVRLNSNGDTQWTRAYTGYGPPRSQAAYAAVQTLDGGFLLAGWEDTGYNQPFVVKADSLGNFLWSRVYNRPFHGGQFNSIVQLPNGDLVLAGTDDLSASSQQFLLMRITSSGDTLWSRTYGGTYAEYGRSVVATNDGGYALAGYTNSFGAGGTDFYVVKTAHDPDLCGNLSGALPVAGSPYHVTCDILVPAGDTLVIEPGVRLQFMGPYKFEVRGTLLAEGTAEDSIVFTTDTVANPGRWRGIKFDGGGSSGSSLAYCLIENGYATGPNPNDYGGGVRCWHGSSPSFLRCTISRNSAAGGCGGAYCWDYSSPSFTSCVISGNSAAFNSGGVEMYQNCSPTFTHCIISGNHAGQAGGGVGMNTSSPSFTNCTFSGNSANGLGGGVLWGPGSSPIFNSTIIAYSTGLGIYFQSLSGELEHSDIFGNSGGALDGTVPPGLGQIVTTNHNGDPCDVYHNIFLDPLFENAGAGDYHLTESSPCIDAGDPTVYDPDCTPSDIGAFYFFHLPQPDSLIVQQQGYHMLLRWSVVDSTECAHPNPIRSYVVYYEQNLSEDWDFLTATTDTFYVHRNVVLFAPHMYYDVVATDVDIDLIKRVAHPGMSRAEFRAALNQLRN